jgi:hypothetical protein
MVRNFYRWWGDRVMPLKHAEGPAEAFHLANDDLAGASISLTLSRRAPLTDAAQASPASVLARDQLQVELKWRRRGRHPAAGHRAEGKTD